MKQAFHQDAICGVNAVAALFARRPNDVLRLFYTEPLRTRVGPWCTRLAEERKPYRMLPPDEMARAAGTPHHGGVCAIAKPRMLINFDPLDPPRGKVLLVLDGIGNPHNLGAIARSAAFFGIEALLLHEVPHAAMPGAAAYRVAEGGLENIALYRTRDLPGALLAISQRYRTVATSLAADATPFSALPRDRDIALVLGNEDDGISPAVLAACRRKVKITGSGKVQSLNVAQAASVMMFALTN